MASIAGLCFVVKQAVVEANILCTAISERQNSSSYFYCCRKLSITTLQKKASKKILQGTISRAHSV